MAATGTAAPGPTRRTLLRGLAATGAAAGAPALLSGCGGGNRKELVFWQFYAPNPSAGNPDMVRQGKWFDKLVADWNAEHEVKVRLEYATVLGSPKLATAFAAGEGPDIFLISPGDFIRYYDGGVLAELTPYMSHRAVQDFFADNMATRTVDGRVYGLPMEIEPLAMFYSEAAMEAAHVSEADLPRSWDDLLDLGDKLVSAGQPPIHLPITQGYYQNFTWYPFLWQTGSDAVNAANTSSTFDTAGAAGALGLWRDLVRRGDSPRTMPMPDNDAVTALSQRYASVSLNGIWNVSAFASRKPKYRYGVFGLPTAPGGKPTTSLGGWAFVANAHGSNPEAAAQFCVWAIGSMRDDSIDRVVDWCTRAKSDIAPRASALTRGRAQGGYRQPVMKQFADEIFPTGRGEPRYPPVVYKAISDAIQQCQLAGADPAEQADLASRSIDAYLTSYQGAKIR